jgi:hypothetical protein
VIKAKLPPEARDKYTKIAKVVLPLFKRLDTVTRTLFIPSLGDGQMGFAIDAKLTTTTWPKGMPKPSKPLPTPELGLVLGIGDPDMFVKAMTDYRQLFDDTVKAIKELIPEADIGDFKFPESKMVKKGDSTLYTYPLPEEIGLDKRIMPVIAVGKTVAAFTLSSTQAERMLEKTPLKNATIPDLSKPLLNVSVFDWAGLLDAALPWVHYGVMVGTGMEEQQAKVILDQVDTVIEVLKTYKGTTSITYPEEGRVTTHSVSIIKDLEK